MQEARCLNFNPREREFKQFKSPVLNVLMKLESSRQFYRKLLVSNFMEIQPVGAELFHADGRTDRRTLEES